VFALKGCHASGYLNSGNSRQELVEKTVTESMILCVIVGDGVGKLLPCRIGENSLH
jgi:hypothetical protein